MTRRRSPSEALDYLKVQANALCQSTSQKQALLEILVDPDFLLKPAAQAKHHAYTGGLVVHTAEVLDGCLAQTAADADQSVLCAAAVLHDSMKVRDYEYNFIDCGLIGMEILKDEEHPGGWRYTDYCKKIRHVAGSYARWVQLGVKYSLDQDFVDRVGHCILAHHGRKEWGSPVEPQTVEAYILNTADGLSAYYGPGREIPE